MGATPNPLPGRNKSAKIISPSGPAQKDAGLHPQQTHAAMDVEQFRKLADFRFQLRKFLQFSHVAAEERGIRPQQYQLLLCVYGMPQELDPTIANVAARMLLKHNSAVELVDRTIEQGLLRRRPDPTDHRRILLRVTPEGERILASLADYHVQELEQAGPELIRALRRVLNIKPRQETES